MARSAQFLSNLAASILEASELHPGRGLKNLLYSAECPSSMRSSLIALVTGASNEKEQLFAVADEAGLFMRVPTGCEPISKSSHLLQVLLYEVRSFRIFNAQIKTLSVFHDSTSLLLRSFLVREECVAFVL
jgi:hypothetical protein